MTKDNQMPERIWAYGRNYPDQETWIKKPADLEDAGKYSATEYIRADIIAAKDRALEDAKRTFASIRKNIELEAIGLGNMPAVSKLTILAWCDNTIAQIEAVQR